MFPITTEALVLKRIPYGEGDWVVTLLTREGRRLNGFARSARKSQKRFGGSLDLLNHLRVVYCDPPHRDMVSLEETEGLNGMEAIRKDLSKFAASCYMAELILVFFQDRERHPELFESYLHFLNTLNTPDPFSPHLIPLMEHHLLHLFGFKPALEACMDCGHPLTPARSYSFNGLKGGIVCSPCFGEKDQGSSGSHPLSHRAIEQMTHAAASHPKEWKGLKWSPEEVAESRQVLEFFIQYTAGKPLKSLKFLTDLLA